jgi:hypothetical protein
MLLPWLKSPLKMGIATIALTIHNRNEYGGDLKVKR